MAAREWPLIAFTLLAQIGVGFFLAFTLPFVLAGDRPAALSALTRSLACVLVFLAAAAALSVFHLGRPSNAWRTLGNLGESWLSREIFFLLLTTGLLAGLFVLERTRAGSRIFVVGVAVAAALAGAAFILSMAHIYRLEAVPAWDSAMTSFSFLMTTALAGTLCATAAPVLGLLRAGEAPHPLGGVIAQAAVVLIAVDLAVVVLFEPNFGVLRAGATGAGPSAGQRTIFLVRLALLVVAGLCIVLALRGAGPGVTGPAVWRPAVLALASGLASEGLGRVLFYALFRKAGV
jgi:anaerobic dimethyl sulfoxide reductase subunit C